MKNEFDHFYSVSLDDAISPLFNEANKGAYALNDPMYDNWITIIDRIVDPIKQFRNGYTYLREERLAIPFGILAFLIITKHPLLDGSTEDQLRSALNAEALRAEAELKALLFDEPINVWSGQYLFDQEKSSARLTLFQQLQKDLAPSFREPSAVSTA